MFVDWTSVSAVRAAGSGLVGSEILPVVSSVGGVFVSSTGACGSTSSKLQVYSLNWFNQDSQDQPHRPQCCFCFNDSSRIIFRVITQQLHMSSHGI